MISLMGWKHSETSYIFFILWWEGGVEDRKMD